jgi:hypothetical protein
MKPWLIAVIALSLFASAEVASHTQNTAELTALADKVVSSIQGQKPDWKYQSIQPITGSGDVILQQWTLDNQAIRIAIISHRSTADAAAALSKLAREGQLNERIQGLGEEGITWGRGIVSFRKGNLTIDVSAAKTEPILDLNEAAKNTADERSVAKEFAVLVADVIKDK